LTAASMSSSVLREMFNLSLTKHLKSSKFVRLLLKLGCFSWISARVASVINTGERSEDRSKHDFATVKSCFVTLCPLPVVYSCQMASMWVLP
jgi:hypothetical protein